MQEEFYIGDRIKKARKAKGLNQKKFADSLELSQAAVSQFESGSRQPTPKTIEKMCSVLDITREELVGEKDNESFEKAMLMRNLKGLSPEHIRKLNELAKMFKDK